MDRLKVLVIGIDGASWDVLDPLISSGELSTFKYLVRNGVRGILRSTYPPWTVPAWNSICSGLSPKGLGYASFMIPTSDYVFIPHLFKCEEPKYIWDYLSDAGYRVIVANVPNTYYVKGKVNGIIISGWLCSDIKRFAYPPEILSELNRLCGGYVIDIYEVDFKRGQIVKAPSYEEMQSKILEMLDKRICAYKHLLTKYEWDLAFLVFTATDRAQHTFYHDKKFIAQVYKRIDNYILKELMNIAGEDTIVFVVSDHGFGPASKCFKVNLWLLKEGYLKIRWSYLITLTLLRVCKKLVAGAVRKFDSTLLSKILSYIDGIREELERDRFAKLIDWSKTKVFAYGVWGDLYVNIRGRFAKGAIDPSEYKKIVIEVIGKLKQQFPRIQVLSKYEAYGTDSVHDNLPDNIIIPTDNGVHSIDPNLSLRDIIKSRVFVECTKGEHRVDGIFICYGPKEEYYSQGCC